MWRRRRVPPPSRPLSPPYSPMGFARDIAIEALSIPVPDTARLAVVRGLIAICKARHALRTRLRIKVSSDFERARRLKTTIPKYTIRRIYLKQRSAATKDRVTKKCATLHFGETRLNRNQALKSHNVLMAISFTVHLPLIFWREAIGSSSASPRAILRAFLPVSFLHGSIFPFHKKIST